MRRGSANWSWSRAARADTRGICREPLSQGAAPIHHVDVMGEPFDELMSLLDSPVFLVTTQADGQPSGCLVSFATQVAVQPPRFMVAIAKTNQAAIVAGRSGHLAVHLLSQGRHTLAELFDGQD